MNDDDLKKMTVGDLPYDVKHHVEEFFKLFETLDWLRLATLFNKLLSFIEGFNQRDYRIFLENLTTDEWIFLMKYTEDREHLSKLKRKILSEVDGFREAGAK